VGWNSWNQVRCNDLTEDVVKDAADAMAERGMHDAGYPTRFPSGIKALADYVHDLGLDFGLYLAPGSETCAMFWDDYPGVELGSYGHERSDVAQLDEWGVDYLKYDWCRADETDGLDRPTAFQMMRDELDALDRPMLYSISEYGETEPWKWAPGIAHMWCTTGDIEPSW
jgi:alpha-galactosidase